MQLTDHLTKINRLYLACRPSFMLFLTIPCRPIIAASIGPIFAAKICGIGRTTAVDDQYEISFSILQGTLPWQPIFAGFIHTIHLR